MDLHPNGEYKQTNCTVLGALIIKANEIKVREEFIPTGKIGKLHTGGGVRKGL